MLTGSSHGFIIRVLNKVNCNGSFTPKKEKDFSGKGKKKER